MREEVSQWAAQPEELTSGRQNTLLFMGWPFFMKFSQQFSNMNEKYIKR